MENGPVGKLTKMTQADVEAHGVGVGEPGSLYIYSVVVLSEETNADEINSRINDASVAASAKRNRRGELEVCTTKRRGLNKDQEALLAAALEDTRALFAALDESAMPDAWMQLTLVHHMPAEFQGHGLNLPPEWIELLAQHGGSVDIDQYVVGADAS